MQVYCDQLSFALCARLARLRLTGRIGSAATVHVLDGTPPGILTRVPRFLMRLLGLRVHEPSFSIARLATADGMAIRPLSRRAAFQFGVHGAREVIQRSRLLREMNARWGRDTLVLHLANDIWQEAERVIVRLLVADALRREAGASVALVIVGRPPVFATLPFASLVANVDIVYYRRPLSTFRWTRLGALVWWARELYREARAILSTGPSGMPRADSRPALLVPQEDDVALDRSYRYQPHWLMPGSDPPSFRTLILAYGGPSSAPTDAAALSAQGISMVDIRDVSRFERRFLPVSVRGPLLRDYRNLLAEAVLGRSHSGVAASATLARLLFESLRLGGLCVRQHVRVFMTCESYMRPAAAIQVVAPALGIQTTAYQYSNLGFPSVALLTTADVMATFSPHFHERFRLGGIQPQKFVDIGYLFDGSFALVSARAAEQRQRLVDAGAKIVVAFFDETISPNRYGAFDRESYEAALLPLLERVTSDPSFGLVLKPQFQRTMSGASPRVRQAMALAEQTGRFVMPSRGMHRNRVFPAEVAMTADIAVGYTAGATASLEAALVGTRSILISPFAFANATDPLYARCDIVYPSMSAALEAIDAFRRKDPKRLKLGDWSPILREFDPYRDGRAGARLREIVEHAMAAAMSHS